VGNIHFDIPGTSISPGADPIRDGLIAGTTAGVSVGGAGVVNAAEAVQGSFAPITADVMERLTPAGSSDQSSASTPSGGALK
jgi:hypothetical protein